MEEKKKNNLFDVIKMIFRGEIVDTNITNVPAFIIVKMMSFNQKLFPICDKLNHFFPLTDQEWVYLLINCFKGKSTFLSITKNTMGKDEDIELEFQRRVQKYYRWSKMELAKNYDILVKVCDYTFLTKLGFTKKEQEEIMEEIK